MDHGELCEKIFELQDDVRYAGVIDDAGTVIAGGMKRGIDSIVDQDNEEL